MIYEYVQRCKRKDSDETFPTVHVAIKDTTLCGKELNEMWFVCSTMEEDKKEVTCRKCKSALHRWMPEVML